MSFFSGYEFFVYLIILLIPAIILGIKEKSMSFYRLILSILFIWMIYKNSISQLFYLILYIIVATYLVKIYTFLRKKFGRNKYIYGHAIAIALIPLILYKAFSIYGINIFGFLGISYICFRVIQVIIEIYDGVITDINEYQFISFLIFFPSISSGPIDRSRRFNSDDEKIWKKDEYIELLGSGIYKLVLGLFYKLVCSSIFYYLLQTYFASKYGVIYIVGYAYIYGLYLFFDFAGYSLMAVGTSYILGIKMPDNFNKPFLSVDIKDFWNRWHISLSTWFRDFVFTRFIIDSTRKKRFNSRLTTAAIGLIINMTIMGIWHGTEKHYILYGIYHGIILALVEIYQKKSKFYKENKSKKWYICLSWFINLNVVMFGFLIFSGHISNIVRAFLNSI